MQSQQPGENLGASAKNLKSPLLNYGTPVEGQHQPGHQGWSKRQTPVRALISGQRASFEAIRQGRSLAESKPEAFACNCINRA